MLDSGAFKGGHQALQPDQRVHTARGERMSDEYTGPIRFCPSFPPLYGHTEGVLEKQPDIVTDSLEGELKAYERFRCKVCGLVILVLGIEEV
jgi:hypothetical protein